MATSSTGSLKQKQPQKRKGQDLLDVVFSWSLSDVLNKDLYKFQVEELPLTFSSTNDYMRSFVYLLLEETHADLLCQVTGICQAPASPISGLRRIRPGDHKQMFYHMTLTGMNYEAKIGDLIALTEAKPKCIDDLDRPSSPYLIAFVTRLIDRSPIEVQVLSSDIIESNSFDTKKRSKAFAVYLTNLTTNIRIWQALNPKGNMSIIKNTLSFSSSVSESCVQCRSEGEKGVIDLKLRKAFDSFKLDNSQEAAVLSCLAAKQCCHQKGIKLIWGPPGTGKTKTVASLLFVLLRKKRRTLTCAPTNIAVLGVATRLLSLLSDHGLGCDTYGLGDIVLFGNEERMKIDDHEELHNVFLDYRIDALLDCLRQWKSLLNDMIQFLENPVKEYHRLNRRIREALTVTKPEKTKTKSKKNKKKNEQKPDENRQENQWTFEEFAMNRFHVLGKKLTDCIKSLYTHMPTSVVSLDLAKQMFRSVDLLQMVKESVKEIVARNESLREAFNGSDDSSLHIAHFVLLRQRKTKCLRALKGLQATSFIPKFKNIKQLQSFCLKNACLIFCTASSSIKLHTNGMTPIELVLIDEAAQLKECESAIPLQLHGLRHAVLVGDERQLPPMVQSKICEEAKFGRSLFERLVLLGHKKHLLKVQYRMHPSISQFPNAEFYNKQILDGPNVVKKAHEKHFLEGGMYGSYSFINVDSGKEELDNNNSTKNMVEVVVIAEIVANLFKESVAKKQTVSVGCISPYKAQVNAIQERLSKTYNREVNGSTFAVNVRSVDGFQGGEEDVIIFSTVRSNWNGSVGFLSNRQRANVALTRARYCLWILGNKETLIKSGSVWSTLVFDAENRGCVYNASDDKNLAQAMVDAMVELGQFYSLLKPDSMLFKEAKWKVKFGNRFLQRMASIANLNVRKQVVSLLMKLSSGWRQRRSKGRYTHVSNMLETYSVDGCLYLIWSVDLLYENSLCIQVLRFWDILPLSKIQQHADSLESVFGNYTSDMINRCQTKRFERNQVLPMAWPVDSGYDPTRSLASQLAELSLGNETTSIWGCL